MKPPFPEFSPKDGDGESTRKSDKGELDPPHLFQEESDESIQYARLRDIPLRMLAPNLITLGAICSGLTAIRLSWEGRFELAIVAIAFAAFLDAIDGRVARFLKSATPFGEQLDSLADFVNFGVTPALVLYLWTLHEARSFGWIAALIFAICGCLRLARFNVMLDAANKNDWEVDFFTGVPAPAGALLALLPVYLGILGVVEKGLGMTTFAAFYTLFIGFLMTSNIPTWSFKRSGRHVSRQLVVPVMLSLVLLIAVLFSYPWSVLTIGTLAYLATIPFSYRDWHRRAAAADAD